MNKYFAKLLPSALAIALVACSAPKDNATLLSQAKASMQNGNSGEAVINLKNILQNDPNHKDARFLLGKIYLDADNFVGAEKEFNRALQGNVQNQQAALLLAKTQLLLSKFEEIKSTLADIQFSNVDDQIYALLLQGQANLSLDKLNEAKENIQEANDLSSSSQHSVLGRAFVAVYENSNTEALTLVEELLNNDAKFQEAWLLKGSILSNTGQYLAAAQAYSEYYKLKPNNMGIKTIIAHNYVRAGELDKAKQHINELRKINENHPTVNTLAAQIEYAEGNYESAKELAESVVSATNNGLAQMISGLSNFQLNNDEQAYSSLNAISSHLPKDHKVHKVLAILQVKLGYSEQLEESLAGFSDTSNDSGIYANLGMEFLQQGNKNSAIEMFEKASKLSPKDTKVKAQLGILKLKKTESEAISELTEVLELDPDFKAANIALAMTHLKNGDTEKAIQIADRWIAENPKNNAAIILRGNIALKSGQQDDATKYFIQANENDPTDVLPLFNLAVISAEKKEFNQSNKLLDKIFALDLEYPFAYRLAISNSLQLKTEQELKNKLIAIITQNPTSVWPKVILARKFAIEKNFEKALSILEKDADYTKMPNVYFRSLSAILLESKQTKRLNELYENWQLAQPNNESAYLHQAAFQDQLKNYSAALESIRNGLVKEQLKSNFKLQSLEAYYLLATKQNELAKQKINILANKNSNDPLVLRMQGQIALINNNYDSAVDFLQRSYSSNKKEAVGLMLVAAYKAANRATDAIKFLDTEQATFTNSNAYKKILAELYIKDKPQKAIANYLSILEQSPNDVVTLNNLAWTYYEQKQYDNALVYAEKAKSLAPKHPQVLDTLGIILIKKNKIQQAISILELAQSIDKNDSSIKEHLAQARLAMQTNETK